MLSGTRESRLELNLFDFHPILCFLVAIWATRFQKAISLQCNHVNSTRLPACTHNYYQFCDTKAWHYSIALNVFLIRNP